MTKSHTIVLLRLAVSIIILVSGLVVSLWRQWMYPTMTTMLSSLMLTRAVQSLIIRGANR